MTRKSWAIFMLVVVYGLFSSGCGVYPVVQDSSREMSEPNATTSLSVEPVDATHEPYTEQATAPETQPVLLGMIDVADGDILERDIIPRFCQVFSLSEQKVKEILASDVPSFLISDQLTDFRRMEGIILPGRYEIAEGISLEDYVHFWVDEAEKRFSSVLAENVAQNDLAPYEKLILASIVEAECLADKHQQEVATVFLNRLDDGTKLQSCVTAEYSLNYQRPYLTGDDLKIKSEYNTYVVSGLPAGPICVVSNDSLRAAVGKKMDLEMYFFYYDYVLNDMFFFVDYNNFKDMAAISRKRFIDASDIGLREKINKQKIYG